MIIAPPGHHRPHDRRPAVIALTRDPEHSLSVHYPARAHARRPSDTGWIVLAETLALLAVFGATIWLKIAPLVAG